MQGNMNSTSYLRQTITISAAEIALKPLKKKKKSTIISLHMLRGQGKCRPMKRSFKTFR